MWKLFEPDIWVSTHGVVIKMRALTSPGRKKDEKFMVEFTGHDQVLRFFADEESARVHALYLMSESSD